MARIRKKSNKKSVGQAFQTQPIEVSSIETTEVAGSSENALLEKAASRPQMQTRDVELERAKRTERTRDDYETGEEDLDNDIVWEAAGENESPEDAQMKPAGAEYEYDTTARTPFDKLLFENRTGAVLPSTFNDDTELAIEITVKNPAEVEHARKQALAAARSRNIDPRQKEADAIASIQHRLHLLWYFASTLLRYDQAANDESLVVLLLSLLPESFAEENRLGRNPSLLQEGILFVEYVSIVIEYIQNLFPTGVHRVSHAQPESSNLKKPASSAFPAVKSMQKLPPSGCVKKRTQSSIEFKIPTVESINIMAVSLFRSLGWPCRVVVAVDPMPFKADLKNCFRAYEDKPMVAGEIWSEASKRWIAFNAFFGLIDQPNELLSACKQVWEDCSEASRAVEIQNHRRNLYARIALGEGTKGFKSKTGIASKRNLSCLSHVLACDHGWVSDVTRRYVSDWRLVQKYRAPKEAVNGIILDLQIIASKSASVTRSQSLLMSSPYDRNRFEAEEFLRVSASESMPTSDSGFRSSNVFILESHLTKNQAIPPSLRPIGVFQGKRIYLREKISPLRSRMAWRKLLRGIIPGQAGIRRDGQSSSSRQLNTLGDEGEGEHEDYFSDFDQEPAKTDDSSELFGEWQTCALDVGCAVDGKVPKNEFGNVEVWTEAHIPRGCVHIKSEFASKVARGLRIDFAPALIGFDYTKDNKMSTRKSKAVFQGIVVSLEAQRMVEDGCQAEEAKKAHEEHEQHVEQVRAHWKLFFRALNVKLRIQTKYGGAIDDITENATYESNKKRRKY